MTQKELLYLEDAVKHEETIINYCNFAIDTLEDEELIQFIEKELKKHISFREKILSLMEDKINE